MPIIKNTSYSQEHHIVWKEVIRNKEVFLSKYSNRIYTPYLEGYRKLGLQENKMPTLDSLSEALHPTGWEPIFVNGYLSTTDYLNLLSKKKIPLSSSMRSLQHIEYALAPDLIHDVIGHAPMLFCEEYVSYLLELCELFTQVVPSIYDTKLFDLQNEFAQLTNGMHIEKELTRTKQELDETELLLQQNPSSQYWLSRLFLWTIEFGLISNNCSPFLYGAALMSSTLEAEKVCLGQINIQAFSLENLNKEFHFSNLQDQVFVADSIQSLRQNLQIFKTKWLN